MTPTKADSQATYKYVNSRYGALAVFANDTGAVTQSLLTYGEWAENELTFLERFLTAGCTVLDVGAYIGTHTLAFVRFVGPTGRVIAIEAQPDSFEVLRKNVEANVPVESRCTVQLENAVASSDLGQISISVIDVGHDSSFGSASLLDALTDTSRTPTSNQDLSQNRARVPAITLDSLDLKDCALIKIDVEGVEDIVLRGALQILARCSPIVYCECNSVAAGLKSMSVLEGSRYKIFAHVVNAFNPDNFFGTGENIFGNAREVALVGLPVEREAQIKSLQPRAFELVLDIEDADDLALALLNKPQYQGEILRPSHAAKTGGAEFLNQYDAARIELARLQTENATLQGNCAEQLRTIERVQSENATLLGNCVEQLRTLERVQAANEEALAVIKERDQSAAQLHALLTELHALLTERDADITRLQAMVEHGSRDITELQVLLNQRHIDISQLRDDISHLRDDTSHLRDTVKQRDRELSSLYTSKSWKATKPLRWASKQMRMRGR